MLPMFIFSKSNMFYNCCMYSSCTVQASPASVSRLRLTAHPRTFAGRCHPHLCCSLMPCWKSKCPSRKIKLLSFFASYCFSPRRFSFFRWITTSRAIIASGSQRVLKDIAALSLSDRKSSMTRAWLVKSQAGRYLRHAAASGSTSRKPRGSANPWWWELNDY